MTRRVPPADAAAAALAIRQAADAILDADAQRSAALRSLSTLAGGEVPDMAAGLAAIAAYRDGAAAVERGIGLLLAALRLGGCTQLDIVSAARTSIPTLNARIAASPEAIALLSRTPDGGA